MQGDSKVIEVLSEVLAAELASINQYFVHAKMCQNWGYEELGEKKRKQSIQEMRDAEAIMDRILFLDCIPNMQKMSPVQIGEDVVEQHEADLAIQISSVARLNAGIAVCREKSDNGSRELLESILKKEEEALDWLESQLGLVKDIGKARYLAEYI